MSDKQAATSGGVGISGLLGVVFVTLKLCSVIDWSWWWVTCPFWGPPAVLLGGLGLAIGVCFAVEALGAWLRERKRRARRAD